MTIHKPCPTCEGYGRFIVYVREDGTDAISALSPELYDRDGDIYQCPSCGGAGTIAEAVARRLSGNTFLIGHQVKRE